MAREFVPPSGRRVPSTRHAPPGPTGRTGPGAAPGAR
ncbi:hypothetical protein SGLAU_04965 [Streptomyces glaucescens]|uniref:Uncharacterized protein n=1 Tax=Streptomyces glaucescens TaxID=1907 RepID=A0A089X7F2_STRGA|nr:hypothetical protein SGLAU_04965 [Streptomyces glaucescens]